MPLLIIQMTSFFMKYWKILNLFQQNGLKNQWFMKLWLITMIIFFSYDRLKFNQNAKRVQLTFFFTARLSGILSLVLGIFSFVSNQLNMGILIVYQNH